MSYWFYLYLGFIIALTILGMVVQCKHLEKDKEERDWTWRETGAVITFSQTGFWFPFENLPSAKRRWWVIHKPLQVAIYAFSTVPMICNPLVKDAQTIKDTENYPFLVASAVMFSLSGFIAYLMSTKMMKYDCDKDSSSKNEAGETIL